MGKLVNISFTLPEELHEKIKELARAEGISKSAWIRKALQHKLEEMGYEPEVCWCLKERPCSKHDQLYLPLTLSS